MRIVKSLCVISVVGMPIAAQASPLSDSVAQINLILASPEVATALGPNAIESVDFDGVTRDGLLKWEIDSRGCDLDVFLAPSGDGTSWTVQSLTPCS